MTDRYYDIEDHPGHEEPAVVEGLRWLVAYAKSYGDARATLVLHALSSIDYVERTIGPAAAKRLRRERRLTLAGVDIRLCTHRLLAGLHHGGPVLSLWAHDDGLARLDSFQPLALCAVASSPERIENWLARWSPQRLREPDIE